MRKRILLVFGAAVMQRLSILIMTIVAARIIGADELGKFAITYATSVNLTNFIGEGLAATANRYIPLADKNSKDSADEIASMILAFTISISLILSAAIGIGAPLINYVIQSDHDLTNYFRMASLIVLFLLPNTVGNALLNSLEKSGSAAISIAIGSTAVMIFGLLGAIANGSFGMCIGLVFGTLVSTVIYWRMLQKLFPISLEFRRHIKKFIESNIFLKFTCPTTASMALGGPVHWVCISILASSGAGIRSVAIFTAFFQWYSLLTFIPSALMNFTIPWLAKAKVNPEISFKRHAIAIVGMNLGIGVFLMIGIWFFQKIIIGLYGPDFQDEGNVLMLLSLCGFVGSLTTTMNQIFWASGKSWSNLFAASIYGVIYISGALIFINILHMGAIGLGFAILLASLVQGAVQVKISTGK